MKFERFNTLPVEHYALYVTTPESEQPLDTLHSVFLLKEQARHVGRQLVEDSTTPYMEWALDPVVVYILESVDEEDVH